MRGCSKRDFKRRLRMIRPGSNLEGYGFSPKEKAEDRRAMEPIYGTVSMDTLDAWTDEDLAELSAASLLNAQPSEMVEAENGSSVT